MGVYKIKNKNLPPETKDLEGKTKRKMSALFGGQQPQFTNLYLIPQSCFINITDSLDHRTH